ncbi:hypothetical protein OHA19_40150 (plasmid) [Streptomyces sp. NBC_00012]
MLGLEGAHGGFGEAPEGPVGGQGVSMGGEQLLERGDRAALGAGAQVGPLLLVPGSGVGGAGG